ncbi:MAG: hypothetical protein LUD39_06210 [Opitutae bacterium]|nr:hypothetical protein [Opitutae bacterium]MCD8299330.1 hypothetical protein [Opitutae bacterium]
MSVRYNVSLNQELVDLLNRTAAEQKMPVSKLIRLSVIDKLRGLGKTVSDEQTYWGARTDLPNRKKESEKRKLAEMRRLAREAAHRAVAAYDSGESFKDSDGSAPATPTL